MPVTEPLIFDGHNDTLVKIYHPDRPPTRSFLERSTMGHLDLPRAREAGFGGGFFSICVPSNETSDAYAVDDRRLRPAVDPAYAKKFTEATWTRLEALLDEADGEVRLVRTAQSVEGALNAGKLALVLHLEGAEAIEPDLSNLEAYVARGLRALAPVWSRPNVFGHGVPFRFPGDPDCGPGLTDAGKALVCACHKLGVLVDVSHLNERGFWDVAEVGAAPLVATHSNAHALCPAARNLTDRQIDAIGESGGLIGLNFHVRFLSAAQKPDLNLPLSTLVEQARYIADRIGIEHVAFGSDFDGAKMPRALKGVTGLPALRAAFRDGGFDERALTQICHGNWLRVMRVTFNG